MTATKTRLEFVRLINELEDAGQNSENFDMSSDVDFTETMQGRVMKRLYDDPVKDSERAGEYLLIVPALSHSWPKGDAWPSTKWTFKAVGLDTRKVYATVCIAHTQVRGNPYSAGSLGPMLEWALNRPEQLRPAIRKALDKFTSGNQKCAYCDHEDVTYDKVLAHEIEAHREEFPETLVLPPVEAR